MLQEGMNTHKSSMIATKAIMGPDPVTTKDSFSGSKIEIGKAINWYRYYFELKEARKWLDKYVQRVYPSLFEKYTQVPDEEFLFGTCVYARLINYGLNVPDEYVSRMNELLVHTVETYVKPVRTRTVKVDNIVPLKKENRFISDIESILDTFFLGDYKFFDPKVYEYLQENEAKAADALEVAEYYKPLLLELQNNETELTEKQHTAYLGFVSKIIVDAIKYQGDGKKQRKPRKRKVKSADQLVSKVKYLKEFPELSLVSVDPQKIVGAEVVILYNTKYKKLSRLTATMGNTLSIKGTTIINVDETSSCIKRVRKPEEVLPQMQEATKASSRKLINTLKTKEIEVNGRLGKETIILKVFK